MFCGDSVLCSVGDFRKGNIELGRSGDRRQRRRTLVVYLGWGLWRRWKRKKRWDSRETTILPTRKILIVSAMEPFEITFRGIFIQLRLGSCYASMPSWINGSLLPRSRARLAKKTKRGRNKRVCEREDVVQVFVVRVAAFINSLIMNVL